MQVQDEITKGYYQLRLRYARKMFNKSPEQLDKNELDIVKKAYPFIISEVMIEFF